MGLDRERVKRMGEYEPPKSIGNGETFPRDIRGREEIEVALMRSRTAWPNACARTVWWPRP